MPGETDIIDKRIRTKDDLELHFFDEVYRVYLVYKVCSSKDLKQFLDDHGMKEDIWDEMSITSGYCILLNQETSTIEGQNCYIIWQEERNIPCLVHELTHLTLMVFDEHALPVRVENQESICYYLEHWVKRITEIWNVPRAKGKPKEAK